MSSTKEKIDASTLKKWCSSIEKDHSLAALTKIISAFRCACHLNDEAEPEDEQEKVPHRKPVGEYPYEFATAADYDKVMKFVIERVPAELDFHLSYTHSALSREPRKLPTTSANWEKMKDNVHSYVNNFVYFISKSANSEAQMMLFKAARQTSIEYICSFPVVAKKFLKIVVDIWASRDDDDAQLLGLVLLYEMALTAPYPFIDEILKVTYMKFADKCKFFNGHTEKSVNFMMHSYTVLCGVDATSTYQHAFAYIRQLAIHMRNCLTNKSKESYAKICNWQFINCLKLWSAVIVEYHSKSLLGPLVYPVLELCLGVIRLFPSPTMYPMRFVLLECIYTICKATKVYVPAAIHCMEVLAHPNMRQYISSSLVPSSTRGKKKSHKKSEDKHVDISFSLHSNVNSSQYQEMCCKKAMILMAQLLSVYGTTYGFPELVAPIAMFLTKFKKRCKNVPVRKFASTLLDNLNKSCEVVKSARADSNKGPCDITDMYLDISSPMLKYADNIAKAEQERLQPDLQREMQRRQKRDVVEQDDDDEMDDDEEEIEEDLEQEPEPEDDDEPKMSKKSKKRASAPAPAPVQVLAPKRKNKKIRKDTVAPLDNVDDL